MATSTAALATTNIGGSGIPCFKPKPLSPSGQIQSQVVRKNFKGNQSFRAEASLVNGQLLTRASRERSTEKPLNLYAEPSDLEGVVVKGPVIKQCFPIRSYEIGAEETASIETLVNYLQETTLCQFRAAGLLAEGFGATPEKSRRDLIWVFTRTQVIVEKYPEWGDVVEVESWFNARGKNGVSRDWHVRDCSTGQTIARATRTRGKLSAIPNEVRAEIQWMFVDHERVIAEGNAGRIPKLDVDSAHHIRLNLTPGWSDLDPNQHVNNVKYISWILESLPMSLMESHELARIELEYRRECHKNSVLKSISTISGDDTATISGVECRHLLLLEDGVEILRAKRSGGLKTKPVASPWSYDYRWDGI